MLKNFLADNLGLLGVAISDDRLEAVLSYWSALLDYNQKVNLISRKQPEKDRIIAHLADSLTPLMFDLADDEDCLDLGSGGGLPLVPLLLARPSWSGTAVESTTKKAVFLEAVGKNLKLRDFKVLNIFLEPRSRDLKKKFTLATTRGLAKLKDTVPLIAPNLKKSGHYVCFKGPAGDHELQESGQVLKSFNLSLKERLSLTLPHLNVERILFLFEKI